MIVMADTLLTLQEVADTLRVVKSTVKRYIRNGTLQAIRVGGRYRVRSEVLEQYLAKNSTQEG